MSQQNFESSATLKDLFKRELEIWKAKHNLGLEDLARLCGVSSSYLGHVRRYGRVPGKPVLILLAFNFEMEHPEELFFAANLREPWPYARGLKIAKSKLEQPGFISFNLDLQGFSGEIRKIVQEEMRERKVVDLTAGKSLRLGVNMNDTWLFSKRDTTGNADVREPFEELCHTLAITMRTKIQIVPLYFEEYSTAFRENRIDLFGPLGAGPITPEGVLTNPFCHIGVSGIFRKKKTSFLPEMQKPVTVESLNDKHYRIAVVKGSPAHLFANTRLSRSDGDLLLCDTLDEGIERLTMESISKAAHILLCNSLNAHHQQQLHPKLLDVIFGEANNLLKTQDTVFIVRPDWPELAVAINDALQYLIRTGTLEERLREIIEQNPKGMIWLPTSPGVYGTGSA